MVFYSSLAVTAPTRAGSGSPRTRGIGRTSTTWRSGRQRHTLPACWQKGRALLAYFGLVSAAIVLFLLTLPAEKLALFLREGMGRYLAQTLGVVWLANGLLLQAVAGFASPVQAGAKATP